MNDRKRDLAKIAKVEQAWCDNFNKLIGPFEAKYEESKAHKDGQSGPLAVPQLAAQGEKNGRHGYLAERLRATPSAWDIKQGSSARPLAPPQRTPGGRGHSKGEAQTPGTQPPLLVREPSDLQGCLSLCV